MAFWDTIFNFIAQKVTALATASDKLPFYLLLVLGFLVSYFIIIWFSDISKSTALGISFIPIFTLDWIFSLGTYTFRFPISLPWIGEAYTTNKLTITFRLLDYIFNFGVWKDVGLSTFNNVTGVYVLSGIQNLVVYLFTFSDVIILFISFFFIFFYIADNFGDAFAGAGIITLAYAYFTNPFGEYKTAVATTQHMFYFIGHATPEQKIVVFGSAFISFAAIVLLISTFGSLFITAGKTTIRPGLEASSWEYNLTGVAFGLSVIYSITSLLHPSYQWYVFLPSLIGCSMVRSSMQSYADDRRERRQQRESIKEAVTSVIDLRR